MIYNSGMDKAERKAEKKLVNFRADIEDLGRIEELGKRWDERSQTEVILRAVRETIERGDLEADTRLDEVLERVDGLSAWVLEALELLRSVPDKADVKQVVKEAGAELRAEKVADRVALSSVTVSDVKMMGLLGPHATATDYENYMASQPQSSVMPRSLAELREAGLISEGVPAKKVEGAFSCRCVHSGCQGAKFLGRTKFAQMCDGCEEKGHRGDPRDCKPCFDDMGPS